MKRHKFLTARWNNLILANYKVREELLRPLLPPGCELDRFEDSPVASLVGFQFLDTRVLGVSWPGFRDFPEWNLRFYVRNGSRRGVCFVREFVPQWFVATMARVIYNEPYRAAPMTMDVKSEANVVTADYTVEWAKRTNRLTVAGEKAAFRPDSKSLEHFFKEHSWGFGTTHRGKLLTYEVSHPEWDVYPVISSVIDVDWATMYGPEWSEMTGANPFSIVFAVGSEVSVYPKNKPGDSVRSNEPRRH